MDQPDNNKIKCMHVITSILREYIAGNMSRCEAAHSVIENLEIDEVDASDDDNLVSAYWDIRHLTEEGYWTTDSEIVDIYNRLTGSQLTHEDCEYVDLDPAISNPNERLISAIDKCYDIYLQCLDLQSFVGTIAWYTKEDQGFSTTLE